MNLGINDPSYHVDRNTMTSPSWRRPTTFRCLPTADWSRWLTNACLGGPMHSSMEQTEVHRNVDRTVCHIHFKNRNASRRPVLYVSQGEGLLALFPGTCNYWPDSCAHVCAVRWHTSATVQNNYWRTYKALPIGCRRTIDDGARQHSYARMSK